MSVERYLAPDAVSELGLAEEVKSKHVYWRENKQAKFLTTSIGLYFLEEAAHGLREVATYSSANRLYGELDPYSHAFDGLPLDLQDKFLRNFAVFHLAPVLRGIELAITERKVSFDDLTAVTASMYSGTKLREVPPPQDPVSFIEENEYLRMQELRRKDPSNMIFFSEGYAALPAVIRYYLEQTGANVFIGNLIATPLKDIILTIDPPVGRPHPEKVGEKVTDEQVASATTLFSAEYGPAPSVEQIVEIAKNMPVPGNELPDGLSDEKIAASMKFWKPIINQIKTD